MIPKTLTFELPDTGAQTAELTVQVNRNEAVIYDGESTVVITLQQLQALDTAYEQIKQIMFKDTENLDATKVSPHYPTGTTFMSIADTSPPPEPPLNALEALKARDEMVSRLFVVGCEGSYYPANAKPGEAIEFVNRVALAKLFESSEAAFEIAKKFPNGQVYPFSICGNYRIVIPQPDNTLAYYNGTGKASNHVNDSIQIHGRKNAIRIAEPHPGAFLLPVTD